MLFNSGAVMKAFKCLFPTLLKSGKVGHGDGGLGRREWGMGEGNEMTLAKLTVLHLGYYF